MNVHQRDGIPLRPDYDAEIREQRRLFVRGCTAMVSNT